MLKVRTGRTYPVGFTVTLGQRNAQIITGHLTPLRRMIPQTGAFTVLAPHYDLFHTVNAIPLLPRQPFIVTFEDYMPRTPPDIHIRWLYKALTRVIASDRCIALLAMSEYAKRQMAYQHRRSSYRSAIMAKTEVLYPAVPNMAYRPKRLGTTLRVLFVGNDFMRKGLPALITAHNALQAEGVPIETTVVSSLRWHRRDYVGPSSSSIVNAQFDQLGHSSIRLKGPMPNAKIVDLMRESDVLVLPTLHDTFGFVLLEAMSRGTPVIATATCAIPEIIRDGQNGWLLPLPNDVLGRWEWLYRNKARDYTDAYVEHMQYLAGGTVDALLDLWEHRDRYEAISAAALETVSNKFNRDVARVRLETLYEQAVRVSDVRASRS
jgi:glycosyltransferase involved in cell wall biosynthesis